MLERLPDDDSRQRRREIARNCAGIAYAGGADTSTISVQMFFLAMAMHPEVQKKAQAEIDRVVGCKSLPDFAERKALPYVNAVIKEVVRWQPASPLAIAHSCSADDEYDGFFIPKGSIIVGNSWAILHDPDVYPCPELFRPERFLTEDGRLDPGVQDPYVAAFGYGRRICPGRYLGDNSLFSVVSSVLATFDILPPVDEEGHVVQLKAEVSTGLLSSVTFFMVRIQI
ncbi:hypothetical protein HGRIS_014289 [Hohenbuehelia grisea]|uniref:Cytochrome P450 n=1 Tax=Hohenbuehelia grisea TaxID=104357 RepID=A0ABR3JV38_9AGAR